MIQTDQVIELLNEALKLDPMAMQNLIANKVECNKDLANHPNIVVSVGKYGYHKVGLLGMLNGLFSDPKDRVAAYFNDDGMLESFGRYNPE